MKRSASPKRSSKRSPKRSRSKVRIPVTKGKLRKYGYQIDRSLEKRHKSLERAAKEYGALSVFKKLNVLVTFNKNKHPKLASKFKKDREWVKKKLL